MELKILKQFPELQIHVNLHMLFLYFREIPLYFTFKFVFCTFVGFSTLELPIILSLACFCPIYLLAHL